MQCPVRLMNHQHPFISDCPPESSGRVCPSVRVESAPPSTHLRDARSADNLCRRANFGSSDLPRRPLDLWHVDVASAVELDGRARRLEDRTHFAHFVGVARAEQNLHPGRAGDAQKGNREGPSSRRPRAKEVPEPRWGFTGCPESVWYQQERLATEGIASSTSMSLIRRHHSMDRFHADLARGDYAPAPFT